MDHDILNFYQITNIRYKLQLPIFKNMSAQNSM
jgi:hypothetical protein